jgi:hypothetical protein
MDPCAGFLVNDRPANSPLTLAFSVSCVFSVLKVFPRGLLQHKEHREYEETLQLQKDSN